MALGNAWKKIKVKLSRHSDGAHKRRGKGRRVEKDSDSQGVEQTSQGSSYGDSAVDLTDRYTCETRSSASGSGSVSDAHVHEEEGVTVHEADVQIDSTTIAVKVVRIPLDEESSEPCARKRRKLELDVVNSLPRPNVNALQICPVDFQGGSDLNNTEQEEQCTSTDLLMRTNDTDSYSLFSDMARGMAYLRTLSSPNIPRNLKPSNILMANNERAVVVNMGAASLVGDAKRTLRLSDDMISVSEGTILNSISPKLLTGPHKAAQADAQLLDRVAHKLLSDLHLKNGLTPHGNSPRLIEYPDNDDEVEISDDALSFEEASNDRSDDQRISGKDSKGDNYYEETDSDALTKLSMIDSEEYFALAQLFNEDEEKTGSSDDGVIDRAVKQEDFVAPQRYLTLVYAEEKVQEPRTVTENDWEIAGLLPASEPWPEPWPEPEPSLQTPCDRSAEHEHSLPCTETICEPDLDKDSLTIACPAEKPQDTQDVMQQVVRADDAQPRSIFAPAIWLLLLIMIAYGSSAFAATFKDFRETVAFLHEFLAAR